MKAPLYSLLAVVACALISCTGRPGGGREGGSDKVEWSVLQSLEMTHRGSPIYDIEFSEADGYHVVCLPRDGDQKRVWIMMDSKSPPYYKQLPSGNYWLTEDQIKMIREKTNPTSTVIEALQSRKRST
jgi:hypothetical protein